MKDTLRRGNSNMSEEEDVIGNLDLEDIVGHYVQGSCYSLSTRLILKFLMSCA